MDALIVEDQGLMREGLCLLLDSTGFFEACIGVDSLAEAEKVLESRTERIGMVLLDLGLPDSTGFLALERIQQLVPHALFVVCSGVSDPTCIREAFARGVRGYLTKNASASSFRTALSLVMRGERYVPPEILNTGEEYKPEREPQLLPPVERPALTGRQLQVLRLLTTGLTNKEIAQELEMSPATVRVHVSAILRALGVENRTQAARSPQAHALLSSS